MLVRATGATRITSRRAQTGRTARATRPAVRSSAVRVFLLGHSIEFRLLIRSEDGANLLPHLCMQRVILRMECLELRPSSIKNRVQLFLLIGR